MTFRGSFHRAQISSFVATCVDYSLLFGLVEILGVWYLWATLCASAAGAVTNFSLNRHWSFKAKKSPWNRQAGRYALVSGTAWGLGAMLVFAFTEWAGLKYGYSKVVSSILVGVGFNYPLHRLYVFRHSIAASRQEASSSGSAPRRRNPSTRHA